MENTTKALLIAAGVLIVIVIISLSILLLKNVNSTGEQADKASGAITEKTGEIILGIDLGEPKTKEQLKKAIDKFDGKEYTDANKAKKAYFEVKKYIEKYNNVLQEGDKKIVFHTCSGFDRGLTGATWGDFSENDEVDQKTLNLLCQLSIEQKYVINIKKVEYNDRILIYFFLGDLKETMDEFLEMIDW